MCCRKEAERNLLSRGLGLCGQWPTGVWEEMVLCLMLINVPAGQMVVFSCVKKGLVVNWECPEVYFCLQPENGPATLPFEVPLEALRSWKQACTLFVVAMGTACRRK